MGDQGAWFDGTSTGVLPIVVGGSNFIGGTDFNNGVWIAGTDYVSIGTVTDFNAYRDISWLTSAETTDQDDDEDQYEDAEDQGNVVPEPTSLLLLSTGLGVIGLAAWRRRK